MLKNVTQKYIQNVCDSGLLAVNDEVLEVNGIEVSGKTLDQVS